MRRRTEKATKEAYFEAVGYMNNRMEQSGIDYRLIGSLASVALLSAGGRSRIEQRFQRPYAVEASQALPDMDVIVPRADLVQARQIRQELEDADVPVNLGLAASSSEIDFRPSETMSYLTHRNVVVPIASEVLASSSQQIEGIEIPTFSVDTHVHTYGTFGGRVRQKDMQTIRELIQLRGAQSHSADTMPFHDFMKQRRANLTKQDRIKMGLEKTIEVSPTLIGNAIKVAGKRAADYKGLR